MVIFARDIADLVSWYIKTKFKVQWSLIPTFRIYSNLEAVNLAIESDWFHWMASDVCFK